MTKKRLLALLMALAMCFALSACKNSDADASDSAEPSESPSDSAEPSESQEIVADLSQSLYEFASGLKDDGVAATVNGTEISNEMFLYWLASDCYMMANYYSQYGMSADFTDAELASYLIDDVKTAVTYYTAIREMCEENGISVTEEQETELQRQIDDYESTNGEGSFQKLLQSTGLSEESFRYVNTNGFLFTNLADKLMGEPSNADLEQYVADNGIFSVKHILIKTTSSDQKDDDGNVTQTADEYNAEKKALAENLLAQLQQSDDMETLFDDLMNEYSEDGRDSDGNLASPDGYTFSEDDSLVDGFREAALALDVGELSGIVETDYGYHILLRLPVDSSSYHDDWISSGADARVMERVEAADVTVSDDITNLDLNSFYNRYVAYLTALYSEDTADK